MEINAIITNISMDTDDDELAQLIDRMVEQGKHIEIKFPNDELLYFIKMEDNPNKYVYGYYIGSQNEEWTAQEFSIYSGITKIEFKEYHSYYTTREFDYSDAISIYIGDDWSN